MREEEPPFRVMRIRICVGKFVMNSVIPNPLVNMILRKVDFYGFVSEDIPTNVPEKPWSGTQLK